MKDRPWGPVTTRHVCRKCRRNAVSVSPMVLTSSPAHYTVACVQGHTWSVSGSCQTPGGGLESEPKLLILISGGVDSTLLASNAPLDTEYLFVHYGQPSAGMEYQAACDVLSELKMSLPHVAHVTGMDFLFNTEANVIPGRNNILVSLGAAKAMQLGCEIVLLGACANDAENYVDCRPEWFQLINNYMQPLGMPAVGAPLLEMRKEDIHRALLDASPRAYELTYSCYAAGPDKCGKCDSCKSNELSNA